MKKISKRKLLIIGLPILAVLICAAIIIPIVIISSGDPTPEHTVHYLNGKEMDPNKYYNLESNEGITEFSNAAATCTEYGKGYYTCDICKEVQLAFLTKKEHTYPNYFNIVTAATCTDDGLQEKACLSCNGAEIEEIIKATGHAYTATLLGEEGDNQSLEAICQNCDDKITLDNVTEVKVIKEPTCSKTGETVYTDKDGNSVSVPTSTVLHTLGGKEMDLDKVYSTSMEGIKEFSNTHATCIENAKGYFNCDVCQDMILVITTADHKYNENNVEVITPATCTESGEGILKCTVCEEEKDYTIPAKGHAYNYNYDEKAKLLHGVCTNDDCTEELNMSVTDVVIKKEATCTSTGETVYSNSEEEISVTVITEKTHHKLNGIEMDKESYPADTKGTHSIANTEDKRYFICDECKEAIVINVAKENNSNSEN